MEFWSAIGGGGGSATSMAMQEKILEWWVEGSNGGNILEGLRGILRITSINLKLPVQPLRSLSLSAFCDLNKNEKLK